jgi:hypothetical protein
MESEIIPDLGTSLEPQPGETLADNLTRYGSFYMNLNLFNGFEEMKKARNNAEYRRV